MKKSITSIITLVIRIIVIAVSSVMLVWVNINPRITAGSVIGTAGFGTIILVCAFWKPLCRLVGKIWKHVVGKIALITFGSIVAVLAGFCVFFSINMLLRIEVPLEKADAVVVLGCQVRGETPSSMLAWRAKAALDVLEDNPEAICVASGGQGSGEDISEAEAIRRYLMQHGISEERIIMEEKSTSTYENIVFSAEILKELGITENIVIATSEFHQYRAYVFAKREGLKTGAHSAPTLKANLPNYWVREWAALFHQLVFGT